MMRRLKMTLGAWTCVRVGSAHNKTLVAISMVTGSSSKFGVGGLLSVNINEITLNWSLTTVNKAYLIVFYLFRIGSDEDDEDADETQSADDPSETAVSRDAMMERSLDDGTVLSMPDEETSNQDSNAEDADQGALSSTDTSQNTPRADDGPIMNGEASCFQGGGGYNELKFLNIYWTLV